jgi:hypothetical protein
MYLFPIGRWRCGKECGVYEMARAFLRQEKMPQKRWRIGFGRSPGGILYRSHWWPKLRTAEVGAKRMRQYELDHRDFDAAVP